MPARLNATHKKLFHSVAVPCALLVILNCSVLVTEADAIEQPVSFLHDVIPALTKAGCNQGACHGAAAGKGGL